MAKSPTKKAAEKSAPSPSPKEKTVRGGKVTFGKGVTLGKNVK
jgi:hypothetical protein